MANTRAKPHKIEVRRKPGSENTIQTGGTTELYLDGKRLGGAYYFKFEVDAKSVAKATIKMFAEVDIDADVLLDEPVVEGTLLMVKGKPLHTLSYYSPRAIATKKE